MRTATEMYVPPQVAQVGPVKAVTHGPVGDTFEILGYYWGA